MIVEVFERGTIPAFSVHIDTIHGVKNIKVNNGWFILETSQFSVIETYECNNYELRVTY